MGREVNLILAHSSLLRPHSFFLRKGSTFLATHNPAHIFLYLNCTQHAACTRFEDFCCCCNNPDPYFTWDFLASVRQNLWLIRIRKWILKWCRTVSEVRVWHHPLFYSCLSCCYPRCQRSEQLGSDQHKYRLKWVVLRRGCAERKRDMGEGEGYGSLSISKTDWKTRWSTKSPKLISKENKVLPSFHRNQRHTFFPPI